jgi:hypothetical protein
MTGVGGRCRFKNGGFRKSITVEKGIIEGKIDAISKFPLLPIELSQS